MGPVTVTTKSRPPSRTRKPRQPRKSAESRGGLGRTPLSYTGLIALALFAAVPLIVFVFNSQKSDLELGTNPLGPPRSLSLRNFIDAWNYGDLGTGLRNSLIIVTATVLGVWICAGFAAYSLARLNPFGAKAITNYLLVIIALPVQLFLVPLFFLWTRLHLYDTLPGLFLIYIALNTPFATLLLRTFLIGVPKELDEAARIDGANEWQVATRVILPLSWPGFLTVGLVTGLAAYNELLFATTFISTPSRLPMSTSFLQFQQGQSHLFGLIDAAGLIMVAPAIVFFLVLQRRFINGLTSSGVKG
jgi:raffinose/stachyose/melibiose transport system permease protein